MATPAAASTPASAQPQPDFCVSLVCSRWKMVKIGAKSGGKCGRVRVFSLALLLFGMFCCACVSVCSCMRSLSIDWALLQNTAEKRTHRKSQPKVMWIEIAFLFSCACLHNFPMNGPTDLSAVWTVFASSAVIGRSDRTFFHSCLPSIFSISLPFWQRIQTDASKCPKDPGSRTSKLETIMIMMMPKWGAELVTIQCTLYPEVAAEAAAEQRMLKAKVDKRLVHQ